MWCQSSHELSFVRDDRNCMMGIVHGDSIIESPQQRYASGFVALAETDASHPMNCRVCPFMPMILSKGSKGVFTCFVAVN